MTVNQRIGWDPLARQIRSWEFDSEGGFGEGKWSRDGERWVIKHTGVRPEGRPPRPRNIMSRERPTWCAGSRPTGSSATRPFPEERSLRAGPRPARRRRSSRPARRQLPPHRTRRGARDESQVLTRRARRVPGGSARRRADLGATASAVAVVRGGGGGGFRGGGGLRRRLPRRLWRRLWRRLPRRLWRDVVVRPDALVQSRAARMGATARA